MKRKTNQLAIPSREEAIRCASKVAASGRMCYGCHGDAYCEISKRMKQRREGSR